MIPNVEAILLMLVKGECSHEQAMAWMDEHFKMAMEEALTPPEGASVTKDAERYRWLRDHPDVGAPDLSVHLEHRDSCGRWHCYLRRGEDLDAAVDQGLAGQLPDVPMDARPPQGGDTK